MADGKYGTKAQRLRAAAARKDREQSTEDYVAMMLARKANRVVDDREYVIRNRDGEYFLKWDAQSQSWETVKAIARWTANKSEALRSTLSDLPKIGYMDLISGFTGTTLVRVK